MKLQSIQVYSFSRRNLNFPLLLPLPKSPLFEVAVAVTGDCAREKGEGLKPAQKVNGMNLSKILHFYYINIFSKFKNLD